MRGLWLFAFGNIVLLNVLVIGAFSSPWDRTAPALFGRQFLHGQADSDSWRVMDVAYRVVRTEGARSLYDTVFFQRRIKFQYPPSSLLLWQGLRSEAVDRAVASVHTSVESLLIGVSWLSVLATALLSILVFQTSRSEAFPGGDACLSPTEAGALLALGLTFYPVLKGFALGQIQVWLDALFAASLLCWIHRKERCSGALLALCTLVKPPFAILLVWGLVRRHWAFAAAFLGTVLAGGIASVAVLGFSPHLGYLRVLSYIAHHGESFFANQSVNGILNRALFNGDNLHWQAYAYAPYHPLVYFATLASSIALLWIALRFRGTPTEPGRTADFALAALASTMASPVAWEHHYGVLLPIFAFLLPVLLREWPASRPAIFALGVSYVFASNYFSAANRLAAVPLVNVVQSSLFASALIVFVHLSSSGRRPAEPRASPRRLFVDSGPGGAGSRGQPSRLIPSAK